MTSTNELWERQHRREAIEDLVIHAHVYALVNFALFYLWSRGDAYPWFAWPLLFWTSLLLGHALAIRHAPYTPRERRAVGRFLYAAPAAA